MRKPKHWSPTFPDCIWTLLFVRNLAHEQNTVIFLWTRQAVENQLELLPIFDQFSADKVLKGFERVPHLFNVLENITMCKMIQFREIDICERTHDVKRNEG